MTDTVLLTEQPLDWRAVERVALGARLELSPACWLRIRDARDIVEQIVARGERAYGINTGLGALCNVALAPDQLAALSRNTLQSHACGVGNPLPAPAVRAIVCAQIQNYAHGHSGISPVVVERLLDFLNRELTPWVPARGSVGYLTHMAHIALPLIGMGKAWFGGELLDGAEALRRSGLEPVELGAKDGLSLVNGTPCATGLLALAVAQAERLAGWADVIGAMSFEALKGQLAAFSAEALAAKPHAGAQQVGANLRHLLAGSEILAQAQGIRTQDALSLRSMPQIHGATRDQLAHVIAQLDTELASATDNPQVFGDAGDYRVISQANPHGQSLAMAADLLAIAVTELAGVAERRIDRLVNPLVSGLPAFLAVESGTNSGLMIVQYVAASLVAECKLLAHPMVTDNYVTSALQEDHLSFATPSTLKALELLERVETVLAIEYLVAAQALHFYPAHTLAPGTAAAVALLRRQIPPYLQDRIIAPDIETAQNILRDQANLQQLEQALGWTLV